MFFEKITQQLEQKKITLNKFSKEIGIAQSATDRWKNGRMPNSDTLIKMCKYLNVSADYLLDLDDEAPPPAITEKEKKLLNDFRQCDTGTQKSIELLAHSGAQEALKQETLIGSEKIG